MLFQILTGSGLSGNSMKGGNRLAVERQTQQEHDSLQDPMIQFPREYANAMSLPPGPIKSMVLEQLRNMAEDVEKDYPKYWNDRNPRKPVSQSSSWVGNVDYDPITQTANIQLGNKLYQYPNVTPEGMAKFLNSGSLGKFLNNLKPYTGQGF